MSAECNECGFIGHAEAYCPKVHGRPIRLRPDGTVSGYYQSVPEWLRATGAEWLAVAVEADVARRAWNRNHNLAPRPRRHYPRRSQIRDRAEKSIRHTAKRMPHIDIAELRELVRMPRDYRAIRRPFPVPSLPHPESEA